MSRIIIDISHRAGASWPSEPTGDAWYYHGATQNRPRASWCVTNTDTQTITRLRRLRLNLPLPAPFGVTHDASATRPATSTTAPPCPSPTRRARGTGRAIAREAVFESRVVVVVSSSVVRSGHTGISRNAATNRKRSGPYRTATRGVPVRSASGDLRTCLVAFSRCDAAAGRPGGCEHFPCLGHSCMTSGQAINHHG